MTIFDLILSAANLPWTVLLGLAIAYWGFVMLGALDMDVLEFDLELDGMEGLFSSLLSFFYLGKVPFSLWMSLMALWIWVSSIVLNDVLGTSSQWTWGFFLLPIHVAVAMILTRVFLAPFGRFFENLHFSGRNYRDMTGQLGTVWTSTINDHFGQIEIENEQGSPLRLNAVTESGIEIQRGEKVLIISHEKTKNIYIVAPYDELLLEEKGD